METNRIRQFCALVQTRNLRKTAEILGMSHSALSKSLKVLQDELGAGLLIPSGRGLAVTDEGLAFYERAQVFLKALDEFLDPSLRKTLRELRIGSFEVFTTYFLPEALAHWPELEAASVHQLVPGRMEESLLSHQIDLAITYEPIPRPGLDYLKVGTMRLSVYGHPKFQKIRALGELPFVAPIHSLIGTPSGAKATDGFPEDARRRIVYRADLLQTALQLAGRGLAVVFLPEFIVRLYNEHASANRRIIRLHGGEKRSEKFPTSERTVFLIKREGTPEDQYVKRIATRLRQAISE